MKRKLISVILLSSIVISSVFSVNGAESSSLAALCPQYSAKLITDGIAGSSTTNYAETQNSSVSIESVRALGDSFIVVTFDSFLKSFDPSDLKLQAYTSDWYSLKANLQDRITYDSYCVSLNSQGKTTVIYKINEEIDGNSLTDSYDDTAEYTDEEKEAAITKADNIITWQLDNGGWDKDYAAHTAREWDGSESKITKGWTNDSGEPLGTIDNDATYTEMADIAAAFALTNESKYKESFEKGLEFLKLLQYPSGGFAQVYPRRGNYSDYVTLNDDAMANVLIMLEKIEEKRYPYNTGIISDSYYTEICEMIDKATDYLINAQIISNGQLSAWCAQHDPETYEPQPARAYEPISISGSESIGAVKFLMHRQDNPEAVSAAEAALKWFDENKVENTAFDKDTYPYFYEKEGSTIWYRFYEIDTNKALFGDRDGSVHYDISEISEERRTGYAWSGTWPSKILSVYKEYGYFPNKIVITVCGTASADINGKTLSEGAVYSVEDGNLEDELVSALYGDVNSDGYITAEDAQIALSYARNKDLSLSNIQIRAAKLGLNKVTATNAAMIMKKAQGTYEFENGDKFSS